MPFRARLAAFRLCLSLSRFSHSSPRAAALFAVHAFLVVERLSIVFMLHGELLSWLHCQIKVIGCRPNMHAINAYAAAVAAEIGSGNMSAHYCTLSMQSGV